MTFALATPEKRLFVSLITRDITLGDAILDLIDNSINAAMHDVTNPLNSAKAFFSFLTSKNTKLRARIEVEISEKRITVIDDAGGIQFEHARDGIFHFGAAEGSLTKRDRLSVFGIGMKRAMFKIGNKISILSDHRDGGFSLNLDANEWEETPQDKWGFDIKRMAKSTSVGTIVEVSELHDDVRRRVADGTFTTLLREKIAKTYSYFLGRFVRIDLNGKEVPPVEFEIGSNFTHENYKKDGVEYSITAGIGRTGTRFKDEFAGWFIYCGSSWNRVGDFELDG